MDSIPAGESFPDRLERGWPRLRWVLLAVSIVHAWLLRLATSPHSSDITQYFSGARSLLQNGTLAYYTSSTKDVSVAISRPYVLWPPGTPFVLAGFWKLIPNEVVAAFTMDAVFIALALVAWFFITETLRPPVTARALLWFSWAFAYSPFRDGAPADWLAHALLAFTLLIAARALASGRLSVGAGAAAGAVMAAAVATRYAYWPLAPVLAGALAMTGGREKRWHWKASAVALALPLLAIAAVAWSNHAASGDMTVLAIYKKESLGFYFEHLPKAWPFPAAALGWNESLNALAPFRDAAPAVAHAILWIVSAAVLAAFGVSLHANLRAPSTGEGRADATRFVLWAGALLVTGVALSLGWNSLRFPVDKFGQGALQIQRYWLPTVAPIALTLALGFAAWARRPESNARAAVVAVGLLGVMSAGAEIALIVPHVAKRGLRLREVHVEGMAQQRKYFATLPQDRPIVYLDVTQHGYWSEPIAGANGFTVMRTPRKGDTFYTSKPITLVMGIAKDGNDARPDLRDFMLKAGGKEIGRSRWGSLLYYAVPLERGNYQP